MLATVDVFLYTYGVKVKVYYNLHKNCLSVINNKTGRLLKHTDNIALENVKFRVQPAGRERVRREGRKNVHAYIQGDTTSNNLPYEPKQLITYNPYKYNTFVDAHTKQPIHEAKAVLLCDKKVYVLA